MFWDEINIWIGGLSKADGPSWCGWASSNPSRVWIEREMEEDCLCSLPDFFSCNTDLLLPFVLPGCVAVSTSFPALMRGLHHQPSERKERRRRSRSQGGKLPIVPFLLEGWWLQSSAHIPMNIHSLYISRHRQTTKPKSLPMVPTSQLSPTYLVPTPKPSPSLLLCSDHSTSFK